MKYKVGDKVRARKDLTRYNKYGSEFFIEDIKRYEGCVFTIEEVSHPYYLVKENSCIWRYEMLEDYKLDYFIPKGFIDKYPRLYDIMHGIMCEEEETKMKDFCIKNYKVCDNNGVKTLVVDFEDGSKERAVCCPEDPFELQRGLEIVVLKHILGRDNYKAMIKTAIKQVKAIDKAEEEAKKEKEMIAAKKASAARKKARYKANKRKQRIAEMKEAYVAAMKECGHVDISLDDLK